MKTKVVLASMVVFVGLPLAIAACTDTSTTSDAGEGTGPCHDPMDPSAVSLPDCEAAGAPDLFSDEACETVDTADAHPMVNDALAATVTTPTEGAHLSAASPATFAWTASPMVFAPHVRRGFRWTDDLGRVFALEGAAEEHCAPYSGLAFELTVKKSDGTLVLRRMQSATSYTPSAAEWQKVVTAGAGGATLSLTVSTVRLTNTTMLTSGPYVPSAPRHFAVGM